ncbi:MAG TPA: Crp/Fnr family transcriptional regulator [Puia sp.]|jgi:CRP/FNR family transcriptional regulator
MTDIKINKGLLFSDLPDEEYLQLTRIDDKEVNQGDYIYFEAQFHPNIYFIKTGFIRLGYLDRQGNKVVKEILRPGDFFGQVTLQKENLHGEFAQAFKTNATISVFTLDHFNQILADHPKLALKYSRISGYRIRRFEERLENVLRNDVKTRLKIFLEQLLSEVRDSAKWFGKEVRIPNYLTHEDIAQLIGTSRQTVTSLLSSLKHEKICSFSRRELRFYNKQY